MTTRKLFLKAICIMCFTYLAMIYSLTTVGGVDEDIVSLKLKVVGASLIHINNLQLRFFTLLRLWLGVMCKL